MTKWKAFTIIHKLHKGREKPTLHPTIMYIHVHVYLLLSDYDTMYQQSIENADQFWGEKAHKYLLWDQDFERVNDCKNEEGIIRWFTGGKLNVSSMYAKLSSCSNAIHVCTLYIPLLRLCVRACTCYVPAHCSGHIFSL